MTNLLVMKEYIKSFYAKYEEFIVPVLKFGLALILFITINSRLGYMEAINNPALVLVAALLCSFLPLGVMLFLCGAFLLAHVVALSLECTAVLLLAYLFILVFYLRFSGKNHLVLLVTPLLFVWKIPYLMPLAAGLFGTPAAAVPVVCGVVLYYVLSYVMVIVAAAFAITVLLVYGIRRMSIDYSRALAILVGALADIVILLVGDLIYDANFSIGGVIFGSIIGAALTLLMQFFHFNLDYARTEKVQFEDDEYYYYVKAVPKMAVAAPEKRVKRITTQRANQGVRRSHVRGKSGK